MQIAEIMTRAVAVVQRDAPLAEAAEIMKSQNIGALPVCDGDQLVGILTDRDITVRSTAEGFHPETVPAGEAMTHNLVFCFDDQEVTEASKLMQEKKLRRLPVLNRQKQLVGVLSLTDVALARQTSKWQARR